MSTTPQGPSAGSPAEVDPAAVRSVLLRHAGVCEANVSRNEDGTLVARIVALQQPFRVPASGWCSVVRDDGAEWTGRLLDVSLDGIRAEVDLFPPEVGASVQLAIESEVLGGGVEGWLGVVRWHRGFQVGIQFEGNVDEDQSIPTLVDTFRAASLETPVPPTPRGIHGRVQVSMPCDVRVRRGREHRVQTADLSVTGVGVEGLSDTADLRGLAVDVRLHVPGREGDPPWLPGVVARQHGDRVGIALGAGPVDRAWVHEIVADAIEREGVSRRALRQWVAAELPGATGVVIEVERALPADSTS